LNVYVCIFARIYIFIGKRKWCVGQTFNWHASFFFQLACFRESEINNIGMNDEVYVHRLLYMNSKDTWGFSICLRWRKGTSHHKSNFFINTNSVNSRLITKGCPISFDPPFCFLSIFLIFNRGEILNIHFWRATSKLSTDNKMIKFAWTV
jgi:hypothetical protein